MGFVAEGADFFGFFWFFIPFAAYLTARDTAVFAEGIEKTAARLVLFVSVIAVIQYLFKINPFNAPLPYATFGNPMYLGAWLALMLPLCIDGWIAGPGRGGRPVLFTISSIAGIAVLLMTRSQSAYAGFFAGGAYILVKRLGARRALLSAVFTGAVFAALYGVFFVKGDTGFENSLMRRYRYYRTTVRMIRDNPLKGVGFGNYRGRYAFYRLEANLPAHTSPRWAHCGILHFAAELGVFRALIIGFFISVPLLKKTGKEKTGFKAALISMIAVSVLGFPFQRISTLIPFFIFSGFLVSKPKPSVPASHSPVQALSFVLLSAVLFLYAALFAWGQMEWKKGLVYFRKGNYALAAGKLNNVTGVIKKDYRVPSLLGRALYRKGDYTAAVKAYEECLKLYFDGDICYNTALALRKTGDARSAEEFFRAARWLNPGIGGRRHLSPPDKKPVRKEKVKKS